jgi:NAD-dependent DNA ligase
MMGRIWFFLDNDGKEQGPIYDKELKAVLLLGDRYIREEWDDQWHMASEYLAEIDIYSTHNRGNTIEPTYCTEEQISKKIEEPYDYPQPQLLFKNKIYVFTGEFEFGDRADSQLEVKKRGGICDKRVTRETDFLVIGKLGSEYWVAANYGTKIKKAIEYKLSGSPIGIVSEDHWKSYLT